MDQAALVEAIHENPESTILIERVGDLGTIRIDVDKYGGFNSETGEDLADVDISPRERERRKRRKDLKLQLKNQAEVKHIREVYTISRINEEDDESQNLEVKDVQKQQRNRRSPGSQKDRE